MDQLFEIQERRFQVKDAGARQPPPFVAPLLYGGAAVIVLVVHFATNGNLGFHTDELYYIDCGRHPAVGYVDFPPVNIPRQSRGLYDVSRSKRLERGR
jgi:hypothetical protein